MEGGNQKNPESAGRGTNQQPKNQQQEEYQQMNPLGPAKAKEMYGEQMNKTITALQKPTSFLLFILMVILVIELIQYFEHTSRSERFTTYITAIEDSRSQEMRECGETIRDLTRRIERVKVQEEQVLQRAVEGAATKRAQ